MYPPASPSPARSVFAFNNWHKSGVGTPECVQEGPVEHLHSAKQRGSVDARPCDFRCLRAPLCSRTASGLAMGLATPQRPLCV